MARTFSMKSNSGPVLGGEVPLAPRLARVLLDGRVRLPHQVPLPRDIEDEPGENEQAAGDQRPERTEPLRPPPHQDCVNDQREADDRGQDKRQGQILRVGTAVAAIDRPAAPGLEGQPFPDAIVQDLHGGHRLGLDASNQHRLGQIAANDQGEAVDPADPVVIIGERDREQPPGLDRKRPGERAPGLVVVAPDQRRRNVDRGHRRYPTRRPRIRPNGTRSGSRRSRCLAPLGR